MTYRGVEVGQILSVELAADALSVDVRVRINSDYQHLVRQDSKFWVSSGIGFDMGLTGIHLSADSLSSVALGGVAFITPSLFEAIAEEETSVSAGDTFILHDKPEEDWLQPPGPSTTETIRRWLRRDNKE